MSGKPWAPPPWHGPRCAYCRKARAVNRDHVVPKALRKGYEANQRVVSEWQKEAIPLDLLGTVPSCFNCNIRKGTRRLVPPSWADRVEDLNRFFGGREWRVWSGDPNDAVFTSVAEVLA